MAYRRKNVSPHRYQNEIKLTIILFFPCPSASAMFENGPSQLQDSLRSLLSPLVDYLASSKLGVVLLDLCLEFLDILQFDFVNDVRAEGARAGKVAGVYCGGECWKVLRWTMVLWVGECGS